MEPLRADDCFPRGRHRTNLGTDRIGKILLADLTERMPTYFTNLGLALAARTKRWFHQSANLEDVPFDLGIFRVIISTLTIHFGEED